MGFISTSLNLDIKAWNLQNTVQTNVCLVAHSAQGTLSQFSFEEAIPNSWVGQAQVSSILMCSSAALLSLCLAQEGDAASNKRIPLSRNSEWFLIFTFLAFSQPCQTAL